MIGVHFKSPYSQQHNVRIIPHVGEKESRTVWGVDGNTVSCHRPNGAAVVFVFLSGPLLYTNEILCFFPQCTHTRHLYSQRIPLQVLPCEVFAISRPLSLPVIYLVLGN